GPCGVRPQVPGLSENIRVRSILGRFLEHSRVYWFQDENQEELYLSSADWMERNLFKRVEACFPIRDKVLIKRIREELEIALADNCQAWELDSDGQYQHCEPAEGEQRLSSQEQMMGKYSVR
ncbi:MAG: RNA degradosome polyphosphate kinase, partial [Pseudomonadota bacterium]